MMQFIVTVFTALCIAFTASAQDATQEQLQPPDDARQHDAYSTARVVRVLSESEQTINTISRITQTVLLRFENGPKAGQEVEKEHYVLNKRDDQKLSEGQRVVVETLQTYSGEEQIFIREAYRLPMIIWVGIAFFFLAFVLGGRTGFMASLGLIASIGILTVFVVPRIIRGEDPMLVCIIGSAMIASTSLFLAHGFHRRTAIALLSTLVTLGASVFMAMLAVRLCSLFGMGSEETVFLQLGPLQSVNLQGLLLGGIVIGTLGVLDDVTTAQTASVDELYKANPSRTRKQLHAAALSIGREHIASLINTLALAYAGSSLPLLLLFTMNQTTPWWVIMNGEFLAEEIVRTFVGSTTLLLAVPVSTYIAVLLIHGRPLSDSSGHHHAHVH